MDGNVGLYIFLGGCDPLENLVSFLFLLPIKLSDCPSFMVAEL